MRLFQYAILFIPNEQSMKNNQTAHILENITSILAKDEKEVSIIASRKIPEEYLDRLDQIQIAVRPF